MWITICGGGGSIDQFIFHELAHQRLYVAGDSTFNESYAATVERAGIERWLEAHSTRQFREADRCLEREEAQRAAIKTAEDLAKASDLVAEGSPGLRILL